MSQFGWPAAENQHFLRYIGKLEQRLLDLGSERHKSWEIVQVSVLLLDFLPEFLNRVVVRRIGRQLKDRKPCRLLGEEGLGLGTGMLPRAILHQQDALRRLRQHASEKGKVGCGIEPPFLAWIKETPCAVLNAPKDRVAFALAGGLDLGLLAAPRPRICERAPLRERRFITKQQQGLALLGQAHQVGPRGGTPCAPLVLVKRIGDQGGFLIAEAKVVQPWGDVEDMVEDAAAVVNELLRHGCAPTSTAETGLDGPLLTPGHEGGLLRRGQCRRSPRRLVRWFALEPLATKAAAPCGDGRLVHVESQSHLRKTLAISDRADREERVALAYVAQALGCHPRALHFCTGGGREGKTHTAHREVPP